MTGAFYDRGGKAPRDRLAGWFRAFFILIFLTACAPAAAGELDELKAQLQALKARFDALEKKKRSERRRRVAPAKAVEAGSYPKTWKLPGTNTSMKIGGYAKLDLIYDINQSGGDQSFPRPASPGTPRANRQGHFRLHSKQSRISLSTWTPTRLGQLRTYIEGDFFTSTGNEFNTNGSSFRLRMAYGQLGPFLIGQTWTTFYDPFSAAETLDFGGPAGTTFVRQGMIQYTHVLGSTTLLQLAAENPQTVVTRGPGGLTAAAGPDKLPDFVIALSHSFPRGYAKVSGVLRYLSVDNGAGLSRNAIGWGVHASMNYQFDLANAMGAGANYGKGIGRYQLFAFDYGAFLNGTNSANARLDTTESLGLWIWFQHRWNRTLRSNIALGFLNLNAEDVIPGGKAGLAATPPTFFFSPGVLDIVQTIHVNLIWSPITSVNFGVEYIWAQVRYHAAGNNRVNRIQVSMQYKF